MRLGILTALHGRERLTRLVLNYWARFAERLSVDAVRLQAVTSDPVDEVSPWQYATAPNRPLAAKFNAGMQAFRDWTPDAVMVIGSDDLVNRTFVEASVQEIRLGAEMVYPSCIYMLETGARRLHYARASYIGAGRVLSRSVLDAVNWAPWPQNADRKLDHHMRRHLEQAMNRVPHGVQIHPTSDDPIQNEHIILDIKTPGQNMWSVEQLARLLPVLNLGQQDDWLSTHFPEEAEALCTWNLQPLHKTPAYVDATL